jgi:hypothetical protein
VERLLRQNPLPLFISGRCGKTDVALLDADFVRTRVLQSPSCSRLFRISADKGGWKKDSIDDGRIILNFINGEADLLVKNATGSTISVKQDGGRIYARKTTNGLIALTVFYDDTAITEDYVFQLDDRGDGMVTSTVIRTASKLNKMSLMTAECRGTR